MDWRAAYTYLELELASVLARVADRMEQLEAGAQPGGACRVRGVTITQKESGHLESIIMANGSDLTYAFAVYRDGVLVREQGTGPSNTLVWQPSSAGTYRVEGSARSSSASEASAATSVDLAVTVQGK